MTHYKCQTWQLPNLMLMRNSFTHFKTDLRATSDTCIIDFLLSYSDTTQSNINTLSPERFK